MNSRIQKAVVAMLWPVWLAALVVVFLGLWWICEDVIGWHIIKIIFGCICAILLWMIISILIFDKLCRRNT
jgi:uncharacterized membrane protein YoaT (DUF817 family)